ncbi:MAG: HAD domain-containing protein [Blastocatellia bacterium]
MRITKVIFLDFDGVVRTKRSILGKTDTTDKVDLICIREFNRVITETGGNIVVSSSWRSTKNKTEKLIRSWGILGNMIGITPIIANSLNNNSKYLRFASRGEEIRKWFDLQALKGNPFSRYKFVIIDDEDDMEEFKPYLVQCHFNYGLTKELADKVIERLIE